MQAILIFNRDEEESSFQCASHGLDWALVSLDMDNYLRSKIKHAGIDELQEVRDRLFEIIEDHGVSLDMIE